MLASMSRNWWMLLIRGVFAILFGLIALLSPGIALASLVLLFGVYAIMDGVVAIISGFNHRQTSSNWWIVVLEGIVGIIAGVVAFAYPLITSLVLLYIVAAWAVMTGVVEIFVAIQLRKEITGEFWLGLAGLLSIIVGVVLVINPGQGILAILWMVGAYAVLFGISLIALAFRVRGMSGQSGALAA